MTRCATARYAPPEKKSVVAKLVRSICILGVPIPNTNNNLSCQIILPHEANLLSKWWFPIKTYTLDL